MTKARSYSGKWCKEKRRILELLVLAVLAVNSCTHATSNYAPGQELDVATTVRNNKHKIEVLFYARKTGAGNASSPHVIEQVTLRNEKGEEARYVPADEESVKDSHGYFTDVWSPDEEWLVLPQGRFQGFCIIKAEGAFKRVKERECDDFIRIHAKDGTGLWHEFQGWNNSSALMLKAGLSGDLFKFQYEIIRGELRSLGSSVPFEGENKDGKVKVKQN